MEFENRRNASRSLIIGVPRAHEDGERRVPLVPASVAGLAKSGNEVAVESDAGLAAGFADSDYEAAGARLTPGREDLLGSSGILLLLAPLPPEELGCVGSDATLVGLLEPLARPHAIAGLGEAGIDSFALELLPRVTRAQGMDVLSSMATIAGYRAALLAATESPRMYPMLITAAGTVTPARVLVIGAGVGGLQAIATSRRLGAVVQAYDLRPVVKEQVESLGARFLELELKTEATEDAGGYAKAMDEEFYRRQRELMSAAVADNDVVITTAAVPGRKAPVLITSEMVTAMRPGSVIVDLAAESGGNCELSSIGETRVVDGVSILAPRNLPSSVPYHASQMLARNFTAFLDTLIVDGEIALDLDDEIIQGTLVTRSGEVVHPQVLELLRE